MRCTSAASTNKERYSPPATSVFAQESSPSKESVLVVAWCWNLKCFFGFIVKVLSCSVKKRPWIELTEKTNKTCWEYAIILVHSSSKWARWIFDWGDFLKKIVYIFFLFRLTVSCSHRGRTLWLKYYFVEFRQTMHLVTFHHCLYENLIVRASLFQFCAFMLMFLQ